MWREIFFLYEHTNNDHFIPNVVRRPHKRFPEISENEQRFPNIAFREGFQDFLIIHQQM